jgi:hypothetical protein
MKNTRTSKAMFAITNRYILAEVVTLDTREQKKEKDSGHADQPSSSKGHDKKRKADCSINVVQRLDATRSTGPSWGNWKASWITSAFLTPRESTSPRTMTNSKVLQMKYSRRPKRPIMRKSMKNLRVTSLKLRRRSTTSIVAPILISQGGSRNS